MQDTLVNAYTPKNILITGGCGFIGSHVVMLLVNKYPHYKIVNYDKLDYCSSLKNLEAIASKPNYKFVKGNILSADLVNYILKVEEIDTIVHFAAQTHVDNSFGNSFQFTETNVLGTHVLLEAAKAAGIKRFIHVSTDEVKGESTKADCDEIMEPTNPYAASKAAAELVARSYQRSFNLPLIITRSNNVYGPHQYPEKIIPKFISLLNRGRKLYIHGNGSNHRNYIFAEDVARAFDSVIHQGKLGKVYSIGSDDCYSNLDVARRLLKAFGLQDKEDEYLEYVEDRLFNDLRYYIDSSETKKLGWKQEMSFEEGLAQTIEWYRNTQNYDNWISPVEATLIPHPRVGHALNPRPVV
jgi:UDP-glucose 4,6-dehydratase